MLWTFRVGNREQRVAVSGRVRVDSYRVARELAQSGVGVVRTARMYGDPAVATGSLVPVLERYWPSTPLYAVHAGANPPSPKVRAFVELLRKAVPAVLGRSSPAR